VHPYREAGVTRTDQPRHDRLAVFIAEHYLPRGGQEQLLASAARLRQSTAHAAERGSNVRYLGGAFVPQDETCFLLLEGRKADEVERVLERAEIACQRIVQAVCLPAERHAPDARDR
jgi:hypothetical protein